MGRGLLYNLLEDLIRGLNSLTNAVKLQQTDARIGDAHFTTAPNIGLQLRLAP